jgi:uncharacterized membrane protein
MLPQKEKTMTEGERPTDYRLGRWLVREDWPLWVLFMLALGLAAFVYPILPDRIPVHWNIHGEVDKWGSRGFGVFGMLGMFAGCYLLMLVMPLVDPKRANYPKFQPTYRVIRWTIVIVLLAIWCAVLAVACGFPLAIPRLAMALVSLLFIVLGNFIGRVRYNWFVGVRTPWSLSSEEAWRLTHRASGPAFVLGGMLSLVGSLFGGLYAATAMIIGICGAILFAVVFSYFAFRRASRSSDVQGHS